MRWSLRWRRPDDNEGGSWSTLSGLSQDPREAHAQILMLNPQRADRVNAGKLLLELREAKQHGGTRAGAGRKGHGKTKRISVGVTPRQMGWLIDHSASKGASMSEFVCGALLAAGMPLDVGE